MASKSVESLPIQPIELVIKPTILPVVSSRCSTLSPLFSRSKLTTFIQEVIVSGQVGTSAQREDQFLVLVVLLLSQVVLHEKVSELLLEQIVAFNLPTEIISQLLVCMDKLLHSAFLLIHVHLFHFCAVKCLL